MKLRLLSVAICALTLSACGGSDGKKGNAALGASFTYNTPTAATPDQAAALQGPVTSAGSFTAAPGSASGLAMADFSATTATLLGDSGFSFADSGAGSALALVMPNRAIGSDRAARAVSAALSVSGFDNPACVATTATSVTLSGCTITLDEIVTGGTFHDVVTVGGSMAYTAATNTLAWDLAITEKVTVTGSDAFSGTFSYHIAGNLAVAATTVVGSMTSEVFLTLSAGGRTERIGLDESLDVNVTYAGAGTCASRVTAGTVEAKRVWTARPSDATPADLPSRAAKVTWTLCGTATIQLGTN